MSEQLTLSELKVMVKEMGGEVEETEVVESEYIPIRDTTDTNTSDEEAGVHTVDSREPSREHEGSDRPRDTEVIRYMEEPSRERTGVEVLDDRIAVIEKLKEYYSKIRGAAIFVTQTEDWTNWGGKYRLNESGASKIMAQLGIHEETTETRKVNETWGYTIYITRRYIPSWNTSASFDSVGSCRSDDPFVAVRRVWDPKLKKKVTKQLPAEEVDESNVLKAALANCRVNGVIAVCGLKTVATNELDDAPNITPSKIEEVSFKGGKKNQKDWKPTDKQVGFIKKLGGTEQDIKACKGHRDFQQLVDNLKDGTHKASGTVEEDDF